MACVAAKSIDNLSIEGRDGGVVSGGGGGDAASSSKCRLVGLCGDDYNTDVEGTTRCCGGH